MARNATTTKYEIIQVASDYFFSVGYSNTSPKMIAKKLELSPGNITYYFKSKEHLLAVIVEMLCDFHEQMLTYEADKGYSPAASICIELMSVATACAENEIARDFFVATFQSEICRNYLREKHVARAKRIFAKQCENWTDEQFQSAELLVMGLQYAAVVTTDAEVSLHTRISDALNQILDIYRVDEETRQRVIEDALALDIRKISKQVFQEFVDYVHRTNAQTLKEKSLDTRKKNNVASKLSEVIV